MKAGDLVRTRRVHPNYFGGDMFESWESHEGELPYLVGRFPNDSVGIVLNVIEVSEENRTRFYHGMGVKVVVGHLIGWVNGDDLEVVAV